jgi:hypothetical protein
MKIENNPGRNFLNQASRASETTGGASFKTHLERALGTAKEEQGAATSIAFTRPPARLDLAMGPASAEHVALKNFESLLGALATYQEGLGNDRFSLKMLEKDLNRISDHCRQLDALTQDLTADDDLLPLLKEGLATARMEIERFQRGDYG